MPPCTDTFKVLRPALGRGEVAALFLSALFGLFGLVYLLCLSIALMNMLCFACLPALFACRKTSTR